MKLTEKLAKSILIISVVFTIIISLTFILSSKGFQLEGVINTDKFNHFGAFIAGSAGILISFAGTILLYVSLNNQREDIQQNREALRLQIEELKNQKIELELTREVFMKQSITADLQRFESTFFNLVDLMNKNKDAIVGYTTPLKIQPPKGYDAIVNIISEAENDYKENILKYPKNPKIEDKLEAFRTAMNVNGIQKINQFHKTLAMIIQLIKTASIFDTEMYLEILKAQLKYKELLAIAYISLLNEKGPIIIKSGLLDQFESKDFLDEDIFYHFKKLKAS